METDSVIKVAVLLKKYSQDGAWSAHLPAIEDDPNSDFTPLAEGATPEEAALAIKEVILDGLERHPNLLIQLREAPKFGLAEVSISAQQENVRTNTA